MLQKKILSVICYYIVPVALLIISIFATSDEPFLLFGKAAEILLILILFMKPVSVVLNARWLRRQLAYRRQVGVAIFWFALFHSVMYMLRWDLFSVSAYTGPSIFLFYGLIAIIGMIILGVTSNNYSVRTLGKNWKRVQYLAYPVLFLTLLHAALAEGEIGKFYVLSSIYIVLKILEWKKVRLFASQSKNHIVTKR